MTYVLEFYPSKLVSKKNQQVDRIAKSGKHYRTYGAATKFLKELEGQIEPEFRDLNLLHPDITIELVVPHGRIDKDGCTTTILDTLVKMKVLAGDDINRCNGNFSSPPATVSDYWKATVTLTERT